MKTIKVKPIEEIEFVLKDKKYLCSFNMMSLIYMQEALGDIDGRLDELSTAHLVSLMLYSGIRANDDNFTVEEANALAMQLDPGCYSEVISSYEKAVTGNMSAKELNKLKKLTAQYLANVRK